MIADMRASQYIHLPLNIERRGFPGGAGGWRELPARQRPGFRGVEAGFCLIVYQRKSSWCPWLSPKPRDLFIPMGLPDPVQAPSGAPG